MELIVLLTILHFRVTVKDIHLVYMVFFISRKMGRRLKYTANEYGILYPELGGVIKHLLDERLIKTRIQQWSAWRYYLPTANLQEVISENYSERTVEFIVGIINSVNRSFRRKNTTCANEVGILVFVPAILYMILRDNGFAVKDAFHKLEEFGWLLTDAHRKLIQIKCYRRLPMITMRKSQKKYSSLPVYLPSIDRAGYPV